MGRLIAYDLGLIHKAVRSALSRKRDLLFLLVAAPIIALSAVHAAGDYDLPPLARALLAGAAAFAANLAVRRRLDRLEQDSIVALYALRRGEAWLYVLFWNLIPAAASAWLVVTSAPASFGRLLLAYAAGTVCAFLQGAAERRARQWLARRRDAAAAVRGQAPVGHTRRRRIARLLAGRSGFRRLSLVANVALIAAAGAAIALFYSWLDGRIAQPGAAIAAAVPAVFFFALLQRQHPSLLRYLLFLGIVPSGPALVPMAMAAALIAGALVAVLAGGAEPVVLFLAGGTALLLFGAVTLLRAHHYATRRRQAAEFAVQIDLLAFVVVGFLLPPLALLVIAARLLMLGRRASAMRYLAG